MIQIVLIVLAAVVVSLAGIIAMRPSAFRLARTATISAPAPVIFAQVNDFHKWQAWSPWENIDPALKRTYDGAPNGTGAIYSWVGNKQVGEGRMTILESRPNDLIRIKLEFLKPFAATHNAEFTFTPQGGNTSVTWTMKGENSFVAKAIGLFMNMDKMIGGQFEKGLAQVRSVAEAAASENN